MLPLCSDQQSTSGYNGCRLCIAHAWAVVGRRSGRGNHSLHRAYRPNHGARQFQQYAGNPAQRICGGAFPESPLRAIDSLLIFSANGSRAVESFGKSFGCDRISKNTPSNDVAAVLAPALAFTAGMPRTSCHLCIAFNRVPKPPSGKFALCGFEACATARPHRAYSVTPAGFPVVIRLAWRGNL
jgi:hypothetical protein